MLIFKYFSYIKTLNLNVMGGIIVKPKKINSNNGTSEETGALNMAYNNDGDDSQAAIDMKSLSNDSSPPHSSKLAPQNCITENAKSLLRFIKQNKALCFLSVTSAIMMAKIIYDEIYITNIERDFIREADAYANVTEELFCFMKGKILGFITNYNDSVLLEKDFNSFIQSLPEVDQSRINSTITRDCR